MIIVRTRVSRGMCAICVRETAHHRPRRRGRMSGGHAGRKRGGGHLAMLGVVLLALGGTARAQVPQPPSLVPPPDFRSTGGGTDATIQPTPPTTFFPADAFGGGEAPAPNAPRVEM